MDDYSGFRGSVFNGYICWNLLMVINKIGNNESSSDDSKTANEIGDCKLHTVVLEGFRIVDRNQKIIVVTY